VIDGGVEINVVLTQVDILPHVVCQMNVEFAARPGEERRVPSRGHSGLIDEARASNLDILYVFAQRYAARLSANSLCREGQGAIIIFEM
jgi:hypothetical protein